MGSLHKNWNPPKALFLRKDAGSLSEALLDFYQRLSKDFERTALSAATIIKLAFINVNLAKLNLPKT
jgi:hypothetical protein